jgi:hypothetical protein
LPCDTQHYVAVFELSKKSWLVAGIIPGVERQPLKKVAADANQLLKLLERWRAEAEKAGHKITRIAVAFETGRDGFWLARWLRARGIEAQPHTRFSDACMTTLSARADGRRTKSANGRNRETWSGYRAAGSTRV